ncbi:translation initiation factor IF-2 [Bdellovibrio bacteriovorus]|uniref:Translation initiation factor IF-2 n=1 Tax=Bdellovibrio bacteriovorus (strain ATCC 15356 / DSM 50701 / NCIMB 9529 / HD100) TaxID=264462 RepID=IF2_BDEBA|nr:translation initiation factor IF-2 [Bdellovibrio bacteriovorus]Q6MMS6.1 RecName: Full=Translation initiation factor IF-2 [Bdellovibrio bacteriovorus HD100]CAE79427.1 translation initiation factor IF-2 [Bdellovibrio bacteriovorus HD100]
MSNPKVFEFAKEIGMTPLALMDKIREWHLPVKSHMAELEPEVLEQIKIKLSGGEKSGDEAKPKKTAARKAAPKKAAVAAPVPEADASSAAAKTPVIRRKKDEVPAEAPKAKVVAKPEGEVEEAAAAPKTTRVVVKKPAVKAEAEEVEETPEVEAAAPVEEKAPVKAAVKEEAPAPVEKPEPVVAKEVPAAPVAAAPEAPAPQARKKEVVVGTSGVSSSATPASAPKRNIIGRMDLSRVQSQAPQRPQGERPAGGFTPRAGGEQRGASASFTGQRPGGFNRPAGGAPTRNIRTGFVAANQPPEPIVETGADRGGRDFDKRKRTFGPSAPAAGPAAAGRGAGEKEEVVVSFNAVEFRKREMVFQPKKKKGLLDRDAMKTQITTPSAHKRVVKVNNTMKLSDLAMEMGLKAPQLVRELMKQGVMANMNMDLDFDTIALIVPEFGWEAQNVFKTADEVAEQTAFGDLDAAPVTRPPVVTVMGHVDHGKTSLLDAIRNADVAKGEAGGITQHIGAYSVKIEDGSLITFLDTPGHEAFTAMRARGANATDIAIIVVAADDGMMPQTQEAINHAKAAGVPIIVAVNKIDKPGANPERIKQQLTELEIVPEEWGGSTIFCEVSALKKTGITELLEQIKLVAEVAELKANPKRSGTGLVIEAKMEKGKGPVATLLVKDGTVEVGQYIVAGTMKGRVRSLTNDRGERVQSAGPGIPVEVLGLEAVPAAGDKFDIVKDEVTATKVSELRKEQAEKAAATPAAKLSLDEVFAKVKAGDVKELAIVLKADVHGSLEAINGMLAKLSTPEVKARVIHSAVGGINEGDIVLANTAKGIVLGFNVRPDLGAQAKAKQMGVDVRTYSIVYELIDQMKAAMGGLLSPDIVEEVLGRAEVRNVFTVPKVGTIAGCFVIDGKVQRNASIRLLRENKIVYEGKIASLKRFKDDAKEVASGYECGIGIENYNDVKVGDQMEAFVKKEVARELEGGAN